MVSPPKLVGIHPSLTAPDAWIAILIASFLRYKQYANRRETDKRGKIHAGAKTKPKRSAIWSLAHERLFTNLRMMVSPLQNQACEMNADMVDLQSEEAMGSYASKVASGKAPRKKANRGGSGGVDGKGGKTMEVRTRRIRRGEMAYNPHFPAVESAVHLGLSLTAGLASRWAFGLVRSLRLSRAPGGPCCSPYRGGDDEGTRLPGSFERMLACVLVRQEGDDAGNFVLSLLLLASFAAVLHLASSVSSPPASKDDDPAENDDVSNGKGKGDGPEYRRIHPRKVKRFIVGVVAALSSLMLFHTPALLRLLGLEGLTEAVEELSARILLFGNLLGVVSLPNADSMDEPSETVRTLMDGVLFLLAMAWGLAASALMTPIEETARNAAYVLSPSATKGKKTQNPNEVLELANVRMMLLIQAMAPFMITCTYFFDARFAETAKIHPHSKMSFSKRYLNNSGLFVRVALSWCFLGASFYTLRPLLQSFLDQAATVASAMAAFGGGSRDKRGAASTSQAPPPTSDPFDDRYKALVSTAGRIAAFPAFVLAMLALAHLRGGDGSAHPGIGHVSQPRDSPRSTILPAQGLLPPYSPRCMSRIADRNNPRNEEGNAGDALLHAAALTQSTWGATPFRDSAHKQAVDWFGKGRFCYPPENRSVKALGRHVNYILDGDDHDEGGSVLTMNPMTGRELLDMAPHLPASFAGSLSGGAPAPNSHDEECCTEGSDGEGQCKVLGDGAIESPSSLEMLSFAMTHHFLTPTIVFPLVDTLAFMSSLWWNYWYSIKLLRYWLRLRGAASHLIAA